MVLPTSNPYPPGVVNPMEIRASVVLPGAGAWDAVPVIFPVALAESVVLFVTYTRGGAGGAVDLQVLMSPYSADQIGIENWFSETVFAPGTVVAGADAHNRIQRAFTTYQATGAGAEDFVVGPIDLTYVERIRVQCRESGNIGTPGTCHIAGVFMEDR